MPEFRVLDLDSKERGYDLASVCENGHVINPTRTALPERDADFCEKCGAKAVCQCENCRSPIRGRARNVLIGNYRPPAHCRRCGKPFVWTIRTVESLSDLISEFDGPTAEDEAAFRESIPDLVASCPTPKTELAVGRVKKIYRKLQPHAQEVLKGVFVRVCSEATWKLLGF